MDYPGHESADLIDRGEARRLMSIARPSVIIHLAGRSTGSESDMYLSNTMGAANVIGVCQEIGITPFVIIVGSASEYGSPAGGVVAKGTRPEPVSAYGRSKLGQTLVARGLADLYGFASVIARPFNVVAQDLPVSTALGHLRCQLTAQGGRLRTVTCGRIDVVRDYVHVADVANALVAIALSQPSRAEVDLCSGVGIALADVIGAMADLLSAEIETEPSPELVNLPAAPKIVGDPLPLEERFGLRLTASAGSVAREMLA